MHEVHHGGGHGRSPGALALELLMICVGVFLGLQVDQWREGRTKTELARRTLMNFRDEMAANRAALAGVLPYHRAISDSLHRAFQQQFRTGQRVTLVDVSRSTGYDGTKLQDLQTTAYDLAIATQALGELPPELGLRLARVYTRQRSFTAYSDQMSQALMLTLPAPRDDASRALFVLDQDLREIRRNEERLVAAYDSALPPVTAALGQRPGVHE